MTVTITCPTHNQVIQQGPDGKVHVPVRWRGEQPDRLTLSLTDGTIVSELTSELAQPSPILVFGNVPAGWYCMTAWRNGSAVDTLNVGVGDVFLVAGQSNGVSQRQPSSWVCPVPSGPGQVIMSDYFVAGKGMFEFRDVHADPLDHPDGLHDAGVAWLYCGLQMAKPYPVKFVIVAHGNTTAHDWAHSHIGKLFDAAILFKPKAILWMQGESECTQPPRQDTFVMLNACIESMRAFNAIPWMVAQNSISYPPPQSYSEWPVRDAQRMVVSNWSHVFEGPDTDTIRVPGEVEFRGDSLRQHGELWAQRINAVGW